MINAQIRGHFETNGKGCFAASSLLGGKSKVCNCLPNELPVIFGAIITSISTCSADSVMASDIKFFKMPLKLEKEAFIYLGSYRIFLNSLQSEKSKQLAETLTKFIEAIRIQYLKDYNKSEIEYVQIFDSMNEDEINKIKNWLKINPFK